MNCFPSLLTRKASRKIKTIKEITLSGRIRLMGSVFVWPLGNDRDLLTVSLSKDEHENDH